MTRKNFDGLETWVNAFIRDRQTSGLSDFTIEYYRSQLRFFAEYCLAKNVHEVTNLTPDLLRSFMLDLETRGRNAGGRHAAFRSIRAFLLWYESESEPESWINPIRKVKPPKVISEPIKGVTGEEVKAMLETCADNYTGIRDRALLLCLLDTGARAREFLAININDVDFISGAIDIHKGKGGKSRTVFIGKKSRKALRAYMRLRSDDNPALWATKDGGRLAIPSLRQVLTRHAEMAGIPVPSAHDFRRSFALMMLRAKVDIFSLQKLMGHSDLETLKRYLALVDDDIREAYERNSPVDGLL
ncbi:MAG: tyrosine-type recombinase/integrase [Anaerolineales bacterium]|nr:tyrosine-type recombinase/integrase [Anaerolineales bacterium]